ncbi:alpha/beta hydrolase [Pedobacter agri]|uniref:alpha/beta hydrolase n=1 Tax=Pedobacter agri TaxID=454586 RepID=UPI00292CD8ED|nr:alpha/beta hydrolase [Pedobacter agri]
MKAYFISGLGADKRIFSKLKLDPQIEVIHIEWIVPIKNESLRNYAKRLSSIIDVSNDFILVGVSFGGMIAVEISKLIAPRCTIIISSTLYSQDLPLLYRFAGKLQLVKLIPSWLIKSSNSLTQNFFFGTKSHSEKQLLRKIIADTDSRFLKWAIGSILSWRNSVRPNSLYHIHGTNDRILYSKSAKPDFVIKNGTHFMVYQNAGEISGIINSLHLNLPSKTS